MDSEMSGSKARHSMPVFQSHCILRASIGADEHLKSDWMDCNPRPGASRPFPRAAHCFKDARRPHVDHLGPMLGWRLKREAAIV